MISHAMGLDSGLLLRSRPNSFLGNAERCGILCGASARGPLGDRVSGRYSGFSKRLLCSESGCKRRTRGSSLISRRGHGFTVSAKYRDSGNGVQVPHAEAATSSEYPCMYVKSTVASGEAIQYPGTVVVRIFTSTLAFVFFVRSSPGFHVLCSARCLGMCKREELLWRTVTSSY